MHRHPHAARLGLLALLLGLLAAAPATGQTPAQPPVTDPAGDANIVDGLLPGRTPSSPASVGWADITAAWVSTDYEIVPDRRGAEAGWTKTPTGFTASVQTAAPVEPAGTEVAYVVEWEIKGCRYRTIAHVPGDLRDAPEALLYADPPCGPGSSLTLQPPRVDGRTVSVAVTLHMDSAFELHDGQELARLRAFTALSADWYADQRFGDTVGVIDHAPSSGSPGRFVIGSDLGQRFTPGEAPPAATVATLAGGSDGDGLPAPQAALGMPWSVGVAPDGSVHWSEFTRSRVRHIDAEGRAAPVMGFVVGFGGDGGAALLASLDSPAGMAWGPDGTLYVTDSHNHRIRAIAPDGGVRTVAGAGPRGYDGDGGPATAAALSWPQDVAVTPNGDLYIADYENGRVRRVDAGDGGISTVAGGPLLLSTAEGPATEVALAPVGLTVDAEGDVWIADHARHRVVELDVSAGTLATRAGGGNGSDGGPAVGARLDKPRGLAFDPAGNLYIAEEDGLRVRRVDAGTGIITTVAGSGATDGLGDGGPATDATLHHAMDVAVAGDGSLYIAERTILSLRQDPVGHDRIRRVAPDGVISTVAGTGHDRPSVSGAVAARSLSFDEVHDLAYDAAGRLYVAEGVNGSIAVPGSRGSGGRIWRIDPDGSARVVAGSGQRPVFVPNDESAERGPALQAAIGIPRGLAIAPDGRVWFTDVDTNKIKVYDPTAGTLDIAAGRHSNSLSGAAQPDAVPAREANLYFPGGIAVAANGDVYWTEFSSHTGDASRIRMLRDGQVRFVGGSRDYSGVGFAGDGLVLSDQTRFNRPEDLAFDAAGRLLVADAANARIRRWDPATGIVDTVVGDGAREHRAGTVAALASLVHPSDVVATPEGGLLVAERGFSNYGLRDLNVGPRIVHVAANGMVSEVAGNGVFDLSRDGAAAATPLLSPNGLALAPDGRSLAFADYHRVRILTAPPGGWPTPAREVRCLDDLTDVSGDSRQRTGVMLPEDPATDLRRVDVDAAGPDLVVRITVSDLHPIWAAVSSDPLGPGHAWTYLFSDGERNASGGLVIRYLAALGPLSPEDPTAPRFAFEHGILASAVPEAVTLTRQGAASGAVDGDVLEIRAPRASVGLATGERVVYQTGWAGGLLPYAPNTRMVELGDTTSYVSSTRSYVAGASCPGSF